MLATSAAHLELTRKARQAFQPKPVDLPARKPRKLGELIRRYHLIGHMWDRHSLAPVSSNADINCPEISFRKTRRFYASVSFYTLDRRSDLTGLHCTFRYHRSAKIFFGHAKISRNPAPARQLDDFPLP